MLIFNRVIVYVVMNSVCLMGVGKNKSPIEHSYISIVGLKRTLWRLYKRIVDHEKMALIPLLRSQTLMTTVSARQNRNFWQRNAR